MTWGVGPLPKLSYPAKQLMSNPPVSLETKIVRADSVITAEMDDEIVMMSLEKSSYFGLDAIGSKIWQLIEAPTRVADLCDQLTREFDVEQEQCATDVLTFLNELHQNDIIRVVAQASA